MKRILLLLAVAALAVPHTSFGEDQQKQASGKTFKQGLARASRNAQAVNQQRARQNSVRVQPNRNVNRQINAGRQFNPNRQFTGNRTLNNNRVRGNNRVYVPNNTSNDARVRNWSRNNNLNNTNVEVNANRNRRWNRDRNHDGRWDRGDRRWHGNWDRRRHNRSYWRSNYTRFAIFAGGYYYFNNGYWYPAYGYDPYFSNYAYDAPIYAYNDLPPGQIMAAVQQQLQVRGYYRGDIDGLYGPMTRRALINFQADFGLGATGQVDGPTLDALGLD